MMDNPSFINRKGKSCMGSTTTSAMTLSSLLTDVGSVLTAVLGWCADVIEAALAQPIVIFFIVLAIVGIAFGFAKSLLSVR